MKGVYRHRYELLEEEKTDPFSTDESIQIFSFHENDIELITCFLYDVKEQFLNQT